MRFKFKMYTQHEHEIFAQDAFKNQIGKEIKIDPNTTGVILEAEVSSHGFWVDLLVEVPDDSNAASLMRMASSSFSIVKEE